MAAPFKRMGVIEQTQNAHCLFQTPVRSVFWMLHQALHHLPGDGLTGDLRAMHSSECGHCMPAKAGAASWLMPTAQEFTRVWASFTRKQFRLV
ncbi:hypothetical protein [Sphingobium subterraneum]|uniref:Uncharacterized protein n=1 Tax=Sphingobium subterraneum TaxID=627688 RepID=A0A841J243_9SPHN|nr:hypothetical protein [Sphingobium subterraneum]MBB6125249.1 hypothetical protein [Sphingobium subterraneum]